MLLQVVDTVLSLIPLLFGSREEKQVVPVVLHEDYIDSFVRWVGGGRFTFDCSNVLCSFCSLLLAR